MRAYVRICVHNEDLPVIVYCDRFFFLSHFFSLFYFSAKRQFPAVISQCILNKYNKPYIDRRHTLHILCHKHQYNTDACTHTDNPVLYTPPIIASNGIQWRINVNTKMERKNNSNSCSSSTTNSGWYLTSAWMRIKWHYDLLRDFIRIVVNTIINTRSRDKDSMMLSLPPPPQRTMLDCLSLLLHCMGYQISTYRYWLKSM